MAKKVVVLTLTLALLFSSVASAGLLPGFKSLFGVEMPSLSAIVLRPADDESVDSDGSRVVTFHGVTEAEFDAFSEYLDTFGCELMDYSVSGSVMIAEIAKQGASFTFSYDATNGDCVLIYPNGTYEGIDTKQENEIELKWQVGDTVTFGTYPQTEAGTDNTPIEWLVLDRDDDKALIISKYALDCVQYNKQYIKVSWENCSLRGWLNNDFYNKAFSESDKKYIVSSEIAAEMNLSYNTNPGNDTMDNVFLLSIAEVNEYFKDETSRICAPTDYAVKNGAISNRKYKGDSPESCMWWLRSPGSIEYNAADISLEDIVLEYGHFVNDSDNSVRPCMWVRLTADLADEQNVQLSEEAQNIATNTTENSWQVGDYVTFGTYPQTEAGTDNTPIEWIILARDDDKALVISRNALDTVPYNAERTDVTWETCSLRNWLNNDFYSKAFSTEDKQNIITATVTADMNPSFDTKTGNDTMDKVFLLNIPEANKYFKDDSSRICTPTDYAIKNGADTYDGYSIEGRACCWWWLRSPGYISDAAAYVSSGGFVFDRGNGVSDNHRCVRPCVVIRLF